MSVTKKKKVINLADFLEKRGLLKEFQEYYEISKIKYIIATSPKKVIERTFTREYAHSGHGKWLLVHIEWKMLLNTEATIVYEPRDTFRLRRRKNDNSDNSRHTA